MTESVRVLLVDDHTLFREGLAELLNAEADVHVVGQAGDSITAGRMAADLQPSAILLDVEMPYDPVRVTIGRLLAVSPVSRILVLTMHDDLVLAQEALAAGARGFLVKTATRNELINALRAVIQLDKIVISLPGRSQDQLNALSSNLLSCREHQVLEAASHALSNAQIATQLGITEGTVKRHLTNIYAKLGAVSRLDAVNKALAAGLIRGPDRGTATSRDHLRRP